MFRSALLNGLKGKKIGKMGAATVFQPAVFNVDQFCVLVDPDTEKPLTKYEIDTRPAVIGRSRVIRSRPRYDSWSCTLFFEIDEEVLTAKQVEEQLNVAGRVAGVGDYRVNRKGPFGRFTAELID
jgi:hypothetical protein